MQCTVIENIDAIDPSQWNTLAGDENPFLRHEFLAALEHHHCVGERYGWIPQHIVAKDKNGRLLGAVPAYIKDNSYGEFVFDWGWADAYHRLGLNYYPKLVAAVPYTPATGPRLLMAPDSQNDRIADALTNKALQLCNSSNMSSLHWLFTNARDKQHLTDKGFLTRVGCQFHWHNYNYRNFEDFLSRLTSRKRKQIKRERRHVRESDIRVNILYADELSDEQWHQFHRHYQSTFYKLGGYATLSKEFFQELAVTMPKNTVLVLAYYNNRHVASAFCMRGTQTLYGRHWGCDADFNSLHFETCYYQGIDYCIAEGLKHFEPGAQGEHKISRGFEPTATWSQHWIGNEQFRGIIAEFLARESKGMFHYIESLKSHLPFKQSSTAIPVEQQQYQR